MLLSPRENGLASLCKEVGAFKETFVLFVQILGGEKKF